MMTSRQVWAGGGSHPAARRYAVAVVLSIAAALVALPLHPSLDTWSVLLFIAAVAGAAALGGVGPGICATLTSVLLVDFFLLEPPRTLRIVIAADAIGLAVLGGVAAVVAWVTGTLRNRRQAAHRSALLAAGMASLMERRLADQERDLGAQRILRPRGEEPDGPARN